ncbi:MAG: hypothetical protein IJN52_01510 [Bacteroidales bacterium]|nr:hypothetical protein [Bacteroidales bacterium]
MKKLLFFCIGVLLAVAASAQDDGPTVNWPYMYPEFVEGELQRVRTDPAKARYNIHLNVGSIHYVENGKIKEASTMGVTSLTIGEDVFRNVGGKMMKVLAKTDGGYVVQETKANYSAIVSKDGAYGSSLDDRNKSLVHERHNGGYNGYLLTDVYADLLALKNQSDKLPVTRNLYLVIGLDQIPANKKSVSSLDGLDKKAFSAFLKSEKIIWTDTQDLVKVLEYIAANR